ncbi:hypothetical protein JCM10213_005982 [Rhodosporidiobolus nylandii]
MPLELPLPSALVPLPPLPPPPPDISFLLGRSTSSTTGSLHSPGFTQQQEGETAPPSPLPRSSNLYLDLVTDHLLAGERVSSRLLSGTPSNDDTEEDWADAHKDGEAAEVAYTRPGRLVVLAKHPAFVVAEVKSHAGVLVALRRKKGEGGEGDEDVVLERMPLATRIGMRLLYHGLERGKLLRSKRVEAALKQWSIREGQKYDSPHHVLKRIEAFVKAYNIDTTDLLKPDLTTYPTLNSFFYRKLRPDARPPASPDDATVISSAADCRLTVFDSVDSAKKLWIKGQHFTLDSLLLDSSLSVSLRNGAVAVFRLAPADYHRYHAPMACLVGETKHVPGAYYTVNSMVVRDKRFDVFTSNKRDITTLRTVNPVTGQQVPVAFVQVGALLVASIKQTKNKGRAVKRGEELGYFAYGGSTITAVFPAGSVEWDEDLRRNSEGKNREGVQLETLVKAGEKIGRWVG